MNSVKRYYNTQAVLTESKDLIPLWSERLSYVKGTYGSKVLRLDNNWQDITQTVDAIYDVKTKTLSIGIVVDNYIKEENFVPGTPVLVEPPFRHRILSPAVITEIVYEDYESTVKKGSKLEPWDKRLIEETGKAIDCSALYEFRNWNPVYILDNGDRVASSYRFYTLQEKPINKEEQAVTTTGI